VEKQRVNIAADAVILALGGGSWPETGSDGAWTKILAELGVNVAPLAPANCGWEFPWPAGVLAVAEGQPLKSIAVACGRRRGEGRVADHEIRTRRAARFISSDRPCAR